MKLDILARTAGDAFDCPMPPDGKPQRVPSIVAAFARIVRYRVDWLGALAKEEGKSPVLDALFAKKEARRGPTAPCPGRSTCSTQLRRRLRAHAEGAGAAQRPAPPLLGLASRGLPARARLRRALFPELGVELRGAGFRVLQRILEK